MDATIPTVIGTGLTAIGTGVALFVALWRVQGNRFDAVDRRFDMAEKLNRERFDMADKLNRERFEAMDRRWTERFDMAENATRERFEMAENATRERFGAAESANRERFEAAESANRERFGAAESANRERFEAMDRRFDLAEQRNQAAHAAICESIAKLDERTRTDTAALHERFDGLNGRFDDLYRHLLGAPAKTDLSGPAPAAG